MAASPPGAGAQTQASSPESKLFGFNGWGGPAQYDTQAQMNAPLRRTIVSWAAVQPTPDSWNWQRYDERFASLEAAGLRPLIVVVGSPCWARPGTCLSTGWHPPNPGYDPEWSEFVGRVTERYPQAVAIEVWNEPNLHSTFPPAADPARYAELLSASYEAVKAVSPSMPVISGGLAASDTTNSSGIADAEFLAGVYAAGAASDMDGIGIHAYPKALGRDGTWSWDLRATEATVDRMRDVRDSGGQDAMPLWITEMGVSTATQLGFPLGAGEDEQARDLVALVRGVQGMPDVPVAIVHKLVDTDPLLDFLYALIESGYGVFRLDGSAKIAGCALSGELGGTIPCSSVLPDSAPSAYDDSATLTEDDPPTPIDVLANDTDVDGGAKVIEATSEPSRGSLVIVEDGTSLTYEPDSDYCNGGIADTFTYTLNGGSEAEVSVAVSCTDDPPAARNDSITVDEDAPTTTVDVLANDTDVDGGPMSVQSTTAASHGLVTGVSYKPYKNYCNSDPTGPGSGPDDTFAYTLNGGSTATVAVTVRCADDSPVAVADAVTLTEDDPATRIEVLANDGDVDGGPMKVVEKTDGGHGSVELAPDASALTYKPDPDYCSGPAQDAFTYTLNGGSKAAVYVRTTCVEDQPAARDDSLTIDEGSDATAIDVLANDTDVDGGARAVQSFTPAAHGRVTMTSGGGGVAYKPYQGYCNTSGSEPQDTFTYALNGGSTATVSVTVRCADGPPIANADAVTTLTEDDPAGPIDVLANDTDTDGGPMTIDSASEPSHGTVQIAPDRASLTYEPDPDYCTGGTGPDAFTYTLNGGSTAQVYAWIACVDDSPVAASDEATLDEGSETVAIDVLANDSDVDGGPKAVQSFAAAAHGRVTMTSGGTGVAYKPYQGYCNSWGSQPQDTFAYTLNGGSQATVSVTVTCVGEPAPDEPPSAQDDSATFTEDDPATPIDVLANDTDADGGPMTIEEASDPAHGSVQVAADGASLTYQPDHDYCNDAGVPESFTYALNGGSEATVSVSVSCEAVSTAITAHPPKRTSRRRARFEFVSGEAAAFECSLDEGPFQSCAAPHLTKVRRGRHRFEVRAVDTLGKLDPSPATFRWRVRR